MGLPEIKKFKLKMANRKIKKLKKKQKGGNIKKGGNITFYCINGRVVNSKDGSYVLLMR